MINYVFLVLITLFSMDLNSLFQSRNTCTKDSHYALNCQVRYSYNNFYAKRHKVERKLYPAL